MDSDCFWKNRIIESRVLDPIHRRVEVQFSSLRYFWLNGLFRKRTIKKIVIGLFLIFNTQEVLRSQVLISLIFGDKLNTPRVEFGLDGGLTVSQMPGITPSTPLNTFNLGFYFDLKFKNKVWMINTGVQVKSSTGANGLAVYKVENENVNLVFKDGQVKRKLSYIYLPISLKHQFKSHFFVKGGVQLGFMHKAYDEFTTKINEAEDLSFNNNIKDEYKILDAGAIAGIGYRLMGGNGMNLGINYYEGLMNIMKDGLGYYVSNRVIYFNIGIPIGAAKKNEKIETDPK